MGGLGLRDLNIMNKAMLMKMLWRVAAGSNVMWAQQLRGKYLPRSELWQSKRGSKCTVFWRGILALREDLVEMVRWQLGDGVFCKIYAQPWFPNALSYTPQNHTDRGATVNQLVDEVSGQWNVELIADRFGYTVAMAVVTSISPPSPDKGQDRLIFYLSQNGDFSVRKAYAVLFLKSDLSQRARRGPNQQDMAKFWRHIWHEGDMPPRIRIFMWKLAHSAIPLGKIIAGRLGRGDPVCLMCGQAEEDAIHLAFLCPFSRACWLGGPLTIRTDGLDSTIQSALMILMEIVPKDLWQEVALTLWGIWRCRNDLAFQGKTPTFEAVCKFVSQIRAETSYSASKRIFTKLDRNIPIPSQADALITCYTDGSWSFGWLGGAGFITSKEGKLVAYKSARVLACCPLPAEAIALSQGVDFVIAEGFEVCTFLTYCMSLVEVVMDTSPPTEVDWRAHKETLDIWKKFRCNAGFVLEYVNRDQNLVADELVKRGRRMGDSYLGFTYPMFSNQTC